MMKSGKMKCFCILLFALLLFTQAPGVRADGEARIPANRFSGGDPNCTHENYGIYTCAEGTMHRAYCMDCGAQTEEEPHTCDPAVWEADNPLVHSHRCSCCGSPMEGMEQHNFVWSEEYECYRCVCGYTYAANQTALTGTIWVSSETVNPGHCFEGTISVNWEFGSVCIDVYIDGRLDYCVYADVMTGVAVIPDHILPAGCGGKKLELVVTDAYQNMTGGLLWTLDSIPELNWIGGDPNCSHDLAGVTNSETGHYFYCRTCNAHTDEEAHEFGAEWKSDDSCRHSHRCMICNCSADDYELHVYGEPDQDGYVSCKCGRTERGDSPRFSGSLSVTGTRKVGKMLTATITLNCGCNSLYYYWSSGIEQLASGTIYPTNDTVSIKLLIPTQMAGRESNLEIIAYNESGNALLGGLIWSSGTIEGLEWFGGDAYCEHKYGYTQKIEGGHQWRCWNCDAVTAVEACIIDYSKPAQDDCFTHSYHCMICRYSVGDQVAHVYGAADGNGWVGCACGYGYYANEPHLTGSISIAGLEEVDGVLAATVQLDCDCDELYCLWYIGNTCSRTLSVPVSSRSVTLPVYVIPANAGGKSVVLKVMAYNKVTESWGTYRDELPCGLTKATGTIPAVGWTGGSGNCTHENVNAYISYEEPGHYWQCMDCGARSNVKPHLINYVDYQSDDSVTHSHGCRVCSYSIGDYAAHVFNTIDAEGRTSCACGYSIYGARQPFSGTVSVTGTPKVGEFLSANVQVNCACERLYVEWRSGDYWLDSCYIPVQNGTASLPAFAIPPRAGGKTVALRIQGQINGDYGWESIAGGLFWRSEMVAPLELNGGDPNCAHEYLSGFQETPEGHYVYCVNCYASTAVEPHVYDGDRFISDGLCSHSHQCAVCGYSAGDNEAHSFGEPNASGIVSCICGYSYDTNGPCLDGTLTVAGDVRVGGVLRASLLLSDESYADCDYLYIRWFDEDETYTSTNVYPSGNPVILPELTIPSGAAGKHIALSVMGDCRTYDEDYGTWRVENMNPGYFWKSEEAVESLDWISSDPYCTHPYAYQSYNEDGHYWYCYYCGGRTAVEEHVINGFTYFDEFDHGHRCSVCGYSDGVRAAHSFGDADASGTHKCACGYSYNENEPYLAGTISCTGDLKVDSKLNAVVQLNCECDLLHIRWYYDGEYYGDASSVPADDYIVNIPALVIPSSAAGKQITLKVTGQIFQNGRYVDLPCGLTWTSETVEAIPITGGNDPDCRHPYTYRDFDSDGHFWRCSYCGGVSAAEPHEIDEEYLFNNDRSTHAHPCTICGGRIIQEPHSFGEADEYGIYHCACGFTYSSREQPLTGTLNITGSANVLDTLGGTINLTCDCDRLYCEWAVGNSFYSGNLYSGDFITVENRTATLRNYTIPMAAYGKTVVLKLEGYIDTENEYGGTYSYALPVGIVWFSDPVGSPENTDSNGFVYSVNNDNTSCTIIGYLGSETALSIPASINGMTVTAIGQDAFNGYTNLTSVVFPEGLTSIGDYAFYRCTGLTGIMLPGSLRSIGDAAFRNCTRLGRVIIPDGVTTIGGDAFYDCRSLQAIEIPASVTSIGYSAFLGCKALTMVNITDVDAWAQIDFAGASSNPLAYARHLYCDGAEVIEVHLANGLTEIGSYAFYNCSELLHVTIPSSVTRIGDCAFKGCRYLKGIDIPDGVTNIGGSAFSGCTYLDYAVIPASVKMIWDYAFEDCSSLTEITIPNGVTYIGDCAFMGCSGITEITVPDSVIQIGYNAFGGCNLQKLTIPQLGNNANAGLGYYFGSTYYYNNLYAVPASLKEVVLTKETNLRPHAFYNCASLESITIPADMVSIGYSAFLGCTGLTAVNISDLDAWAQIDFGDASSNPLFYAQHLYLDGNELTEISFTEGLTSIGNYAFFNGKGLTGITIPASVTTIGDSAFKGCSGLTEITLPTGLNSLGYSAFSGCTGLTDVTVPGNVRRLWGYIFEGCTGLTSITISEGVTYVGEYTFMNCTGLTEIILPNSVTHIGNGAFFGCSNLEKLALSLVAKNESTFLGYLFGAYSSYENASYVPNSLKEIIILNATNIGTRAFSNCAGLESITIPAGVKSIGYSAFLGCRNLNRVNISDLDAWAQIDFAEASSNPLFYAKHLYLNGSELTRITLSDGLTYVGNYAFYNGSSLTKVTLPAGMTRIGDSAFNGCSGLTTFTIPETVTSLGYSAFGDCTGLTSITIPDSVTTVWGYVFQGCTGLKNITFSAAMTTINEGMFMNCTGLKSLTIPATIKDIEEYAFKGCTGLTNLVLSEGVQYVGYAAFADCTGLTSVTFPTTLTRVGRYAFERCTNLSEVYILARPVSFGYYTFYKCAPVVNIYRDFDDDNWDYSFTAVEDEDHSIIVTRLKHVLPAPVLTIEMDSATGRPIIRWDPVEGAVKYLVYRKAGSNSWALQTSGGITATSYQSAKANVGTTYKYRVIATSPDGSAYNSDYSESVTMACIMPAPAVILTKTETGEPILSWEAVTGAAGYRIYRKAGSADWQILQDAFTATTFTDSGLTDGTEYSYKLITLTDVGEAFNSADSNTVSAVYVKPVLAAPVLTIVMDEATGRPIISWEPVEGALKYLIYRKAGSNNWALQTTSGTTATTYQSAKANVGTTYKYRVVAVSPLGSAYNSDYSASVTMACILPAPTVTLTDETEAIRVSWNANADATEYSIYRKVNAGAWTILAEHVAGTSYTDGSVKLDTEYSYKVMAAAAAGEDFNSAFSSPVSMTLTRKNLPAPVLSIAMDEASGKPVVTWDAVEGASKYLVYRKAGSNNWALQSSAGTTATTYQSSKATVGVTYKYRVIAVSPEGSALNSDYSNTVEMACILPAPVVTLAKNTIGDPVIKWSAVSGAAEYRIYRKVAAGDWECLADGIIDVSYTDTGLTVGTQYSYKVVAAAAAGEAYNSESSTVSTTYEKSALLPPVLTVEMDEATGRPIVSWEAIDGAEKYLVYRKAGSNSWTLQTKNGIEETSYQNSSLTVGNTYKYRVIAVSPEGSAFNSDYSNTVEMACILPQPKAGIAKDDATGDHVISWKAVSNAAEYRIIRKAGDGSWEDLADGITGTSYADEGLIVGTEYSYRVIAVSAKGDAYNSAASDPVSMVYTKPALQAPVLTIEMDEATGRPVISWEPVEGAEKYLVYRKAGSNAWSLLNKNGTTKTSYQNSSLTVGTTYKYRIVAVSPDGSEFNSVYSNTVTMACILAKPAVSIEKEKETGCPIVSWKAVSGAAAYDVYRKAGDGEWETVGDGISDISFADGGLTVGVEYTYKVVAKAAKGAAYDSAESKEVSEICTLPAPVITLTLDETTGKPVISWEAVEGASKYYVYRKAGSNSWALQTTSGTTATRWLNSKVNDGQTYQYRVVAVCPLSKDFNSSYSNVVSLTYTAQ